MECEKIKALIIKEDLGGSEKKEIETHIKVCAECRKFYQFYNSISSYMSDLPEIIPEKDLYEKIIGKIRLQEKIKKFLYIYAFSFVVTAFLFVFTLGETKKFFIEFVEKFFKFTFIFKTLAPFIFKISILFLIPFSANIIIFFISSFIFYKFYKRKVLSLF